MLEGFISTAYIVDAHLPYCQSYTVTCFLTLAIYGHREKYMSWKWRRQFLTITQHGSLTSKSCLSIFSKDDLIYTNVWGISDACFLKQRATIIKGLWSHQFIRGSRLLPSNTEALSLVDCSQQQPWSWPIHINPLKVIYRYTWHYGYYFYFFLCSMFLLMCFSCRVKPLTFTQRRKPL